MESGDDRANRLYSLLNTSTPFAPGSTEEARERLTVSEPSRAAELSEAVQAAETVPGLQELTKVTRELQALTRSLGLPF